MSGKEIAVEVVCALAFRQVICFLNIPAGSTVFDAVRESGVLIEFREIEFDSSRLGIFGRLVSPDEILREGDRVEIYRQLAADPKEARRQRAAMVKSGC